MDVMQATYETAKELVWPTRCAVCDEPGFVLCEECAANLRFIDLCHACKKCGASGGKVQCTECNDIMVLANGFAEYPLDQFRSCCILNEDARKIITAYKDRTELRLAPVIAKIMARYFEPAWIQKNALITYVPSSKEALVRRGFSHMGKIAKELSLLTNLETECVFEALATNDQRELGRKERVVNMASKFKVRKGLQIPHACPIVVIDDVSTTGATIMCAANALKRAGYETVYGLSFARVMN
ncbi:MAG: ComF family protein [Phoenicibacter congonensis]|uniref:ComF family protein n=1 Tax=Phoenicibacter congonensis TaxID=1944646 RepID=A0AA43RGF0_9ACTN|nr:ComF family protein [Phoenicibacter congonensis]